MNEKSLKRLKRFKKYDIIKVEYRCEDCGNIIYRTLEKNETEHLIRNKEDFEPILCPICEEEKMIIYGIITEKEFYKNYPDFMSGG
ncbi:MAG: hypothetical protein HWN67_23480 [Candidatus Helarchaeota archaeon]|nr:hypothetical protein [Candidatus Helarchaeota archaeon]